MTGLLTATFILGGLLGAFLHARFAKTSPPSVIYVDRPVVATPVGSALPITDSAGPVAPAPTERGIAPTFKQRSIPSSSSPRISQLDAERALLDGARTALVSGDSDTALRLLDRHAKRYARPILGEERDALFVQALVRAGRYDEARVRAAAFRRAAPDSLFLPAVDTAIASIP